MSLTSLPSSSAPCNYNSYVNKNKRTRKKLSGSLTAFFAAAVSSSNRVPGVAHGVILLFEKSKLVVATDDKPPAPQSTELNMRRGNFTIRMWQRGQEQSCRPGALGGDVMDGFVNDTGEFVLDPQATVAARNKDFFFEGPLCLQKRTQRKLRLPAERFSLPRWMRLRRYACRRRAPKCGWI
jgi:hypothetical protein